MRRLISAVAITLALLSVAAPSQALFRVDTAQSHLHGGSIHNSKHHQTVSIIGWVGVQRRIYFRHAPHWRRHTFYAMRVSMQRCRSTGCWGPVKHGTLAPRRGFPGRPVKASSKAMAGLSTDVCYLNTYVCAAPWNWFGHSVDTEQQTIRQYYVYPCIAGGLGGFGGATATNLSVRMLFETGLITSATTSKMAVGPEGAAVVSLAGCFTGMGLGVYRNVRDLVQAWGG